MGQSERIQEFSKEAECRPKGIVEPRERGTDEVSRSPSEQLQLSAQSVLFAWKKDDYSVQSFKSEKKIAILWRNSSVLKDASTVTRARVLAKERRELRGRCHTPVKFDKNRTAVEQGVKISWHLHHAIYPRGHQPFVSS